MLALTPVGDAQADPTDVKATTEIVTGKWDGDWKRTGTPTAWEAQEFQYVHGVWTRDGGPLGIELLCFQEEAPCFTGSTTSGSWTSLTEEGTIDSINFERFLFYDIAGSLAGGDLTPEAKLGPDAVGTYRRVGLDGKDTWELDVVTDLSVCWDDKSDLPCDEAWAVAPVDLDFTGEATEVAAANIQRLTGTFSMTSPATDPLLDLDPLIDFEPSDIRTPSQDCELNGGTRVVDSTTEGVYTKLYTHQPSSDEVWVCTRVEDTGSGDGYGGKLVIDSSGADPEISGGGVGTPSTDGDSTACTTTSDPPNLVPGNHPIAHGGIGPVDYMVDAYANGQEAWLCLEADSAATRVVVPFEEPNPSVSLGTVIAWHPDEEPPDA